MAHDSSNMFIRDVCKNAERVSGRQPILWKTDTGSWRKSNSEKKGELQYLEINFAEKNTPIFKVIDVNSKRN